VVIAHRGASYYSRENTLEAIEIAVDMGPEMVEFDVRRTADGVLVIHHDQDFDNVKILDMTMNQIRERFGSKEYTVPTLAEALRLCKGKILPDIEIKEHGYEEQLLEMALDILGSERFIISSGHDTVVGKVKALRPEVRTGLILSCCPFPGFVRNLFPSARVRMTGVDIVMVNRQLLRLGFLNLNAGLKKPVWVYTINDRKEMWKYITDSRVGGVFTDRPDVGLFLRDLHAVNQEGEYRIKSGD